MAIQFEPLSADLSGSVYDLIDREIKYYLDDERRNLVVRLVEHDGRQIGFVIQSLRASEFYPTNAMLQLYVEHGSEEIMEAVWQAANELNPVDAAITTTEDMYCMWLYQKHYATLRPLSLCFEHGDFVEGDDLPSDVRIGKAGPQHREQMRAVEKEIYEFFKIEFNTDSGDVKRTDVQLNNGDLYFIESSDEIVGLGSANFHYETKGKVEIGYAVRPTYWRKGYGTLMARHLKLECQRAGLAASAHCDLGNWPSIRVLQKSKMVCRAVRLLYEFTRGA